MQRLARSFTSLGRAILSFADAPWDDALSHGQMQSKAWAVNELIKLNRNLGVIDLLGGWLGTLPLLMFEAPKLRFKKIRSFDIDPACEAIADQLNIEYVIDGWRFKAITKDMYKVSYGANHRYPIVTSDKVVTIVETCDTIINTSCDHLAHFSRWWAMIPAGKLVLIQNNNFADGGDDHVNTVKNLSVMMTQAPMRRVLFSGKLELAKYQRFMLIGLK